MTLIEVIDAARSLCNDELSACRTFPDNTSSFWKDSTLINYFNVIQQDVSLEIMQTFEDYFLTSTDFNISANVAAYTLPTRFVKCRRVEDLENSAAPYEILPTTINERNDSYFRRTNSGVLSYGYYKIQGNQFVLETTPDTTRNSAIRMHYIRALADVTAASNSSDIPVEHHRVIVWGLVRYMLFQEGRDTSKADGEYQAMVLNLKKQAENRQIQRPRKVKEYGHVFGGGY